VHKIVKRWFVIGAVEAVGVIGLTLAAPPIINAGRPMLGFAMFGGAIALSCGSTAYVSCRLGTAWRARQRLLRRFPQYEAVPLTSFLEVSPTQVSQALDLLEALGDEKALITSHNLIAFIKEGSPP
jgi:hypothetical protein